MGYLPEYMIKVNAVFSVLFLVYYLLFRKEKFLNLNRALLIFIIIAGFVFPLCPALNFGKPVIIPQRIRTIAVPESSVILPLENSSALPAKTIKHDIKVNYWELAAIFYSAGVLVLFIVFLFHLRQLYTIVKNSKRIKANGVIYCDPSFAIPPFSFFHFIVVSDVAFKPELYQQIILHERAHSRQLHSIDVMLAEIACIVLWINPLIYVFRRQLKLNLEFLADEATLNTGIDAQSYQLNLLRSVMKGPIYLPANSFFSSKLKERIQMMNQLVPHFKYAYKYLLLLPFLVSLSAFTGFKRKKISENTASLPLVQQRAEISQSLAVHQVASLPIPMQRASSLVMSAKKAAPSTIVMHHHFQKLFVEATTDTVKFKLIPDRKGHGKLYNGIFAIDDKIFLTDKQIRDSIKRNGKLNYVFAKPPIIGYFTPKDSVAIKYWGKRARNGVFFIRSQPEQIITQQ